MRVFVAGSSGLIGTALCAKLQTDGHKVVRLVRRPASAENELRWNPAQPEPELLDGADAVINLGGAGLGDHRWTRRYREVISASRIETTRSLAAMAAGAESPPAVLISMSGIRYYGVDRADEPLTESSAPGHDGFLPEVTRAWEAATAEAEAVGVRVCHLRTGLVLSGDGGLLPRLVPLFRTGLGATLGPKQNFWSLLSLQDTTDAIGFLIRRPDLSGPFNLAAPNPVRASDFTNTLAALTRRPAVLHVPMWALRAAQGEMAREVLGSLRVLPERLTEAGFRFRHPDVETALRATLQ